MQDSPQAARAIAAIAASLPVYSGLVETARANNRQGFPVGAAYLRDASNLMRGRILPPPATSTGSSRAGSTTTSAAATRAAGSTRPARARPGPRRADRRAGAAGPPNPARCSTSGLVAATALVVVLGAWLTIVMVRAGNARRDAQRTGSDSVQVLSAARILALRAQADESLALVARGGGDQLS